jgi:type IV secretory pathway VirB2 component (pilin)
MQLSDVLAIVFVVVAGAAFLLGEGALARAEDIRAIYWLVVGATSLHAAVQIARPGAKA